VAFPRAAETEGLMKRENKDVLQWAWERR
jgi:hypothetical protein